MRLSSKTAILTSAGVILLGTSLALSSAGVVSGASPIGGSRLVQPRYYLQQLKWLLPD